MKLEQATRQALNWIDANAPRYVFEAIEEALAEQANVSDGLCGGCAKKAADGWALYCVECWEKAEQEPVAWIDLTKEELHQIEINCETSAECYRVIAKALKDRNSAVTQPVQEPVAWGYFDADGSFMDALDRQHGAYQTPLYAAPVRTKDLTDDEIKEIWSFGNGAIYFARAVIAADREKNRETA